MSLWTNINFFPEPTGELYGWLLATLVKTQNANMCVNINIYFKESKRLTKTPIDNPQALYTLLSFSNVSVKDSIYIS